MRRAARGVEKAGDFVAEVALRRVPAVQDLVELRGPVDLRRRKRRAGVIARESTWRDPPLAARRTDVLGGASVVAPAGRGQEDAVCGRAVGMALKGCDMGVIRSTGSRERRPVSGSW